MRILLPISEDSGKDLRQAGETKLLIQYREVEMREHSWVKAFLLILMIVEGTMVSSAILDATNVSKISAEIILNQLNGSQPVIYDGVEILGDLDLSPSKDDENKLLNLINSSLIITNSTFHGGIYSYQALIKKPIIIEGCIIEGAVHLQNVSFLDLAGFNSTIFQKKAFFSQSIFSGDAHFRGCTFQAEEGDFNGSKFMSVANFDEAKFDAARFTDCQFQGYSRFGKAIFQQSADFEGSDSSMALALTRLNSMEEPS